GSTPFVRVLREAVDRRILQANLLQIGSRKEQLYVSLGHDALAKVVASWDDELRFRARIWKMVIITATATSLAVILALLSLIASTRAVRARAAEIEALKTLPLAQQTADQMLTQVGDIDLAEVPQVEPVRRRLLEKARASYSEMIESLASGSDLAQI